MEERELLAIINSQRRESLGVDDGELSLERAEAYDRYHGRPYGNEQEGRSQVVSKDLAEAVDWVMPAIMKVFTKSGGVVEFVPVGPEDEDGAKQETNYVNHVFIQENDGWLVLFDIIKDALLLKNGYVKHWWIEDEKIREEKYQNLTYDDLAMIFTDLTQDGRSVEIVGQEVTIDETTGRESIDLKLKIIDKSQKLIVEAVPAEEVRVSTRCRGSLQTSPFTEHVTKKYRSDLIEMGMDKDFVNDLPAWSGQGDRDTNTEARARDSVWEESEYDQQSFIDKSMDEITYCEAYIRVDWDGDGVAELRRVVSVGDRIPEGEEWNKAIEAVSMTSFQAKRIPHRHVGESLNDDLSDIAEIKTTLTRQMLDNVYRSNDQQWLVNERVVLKDFLLSVPGGVKRIKGKEPVEGSVQPVATKPIINELLGAIGYMDDVKENRTGITKTSTGLDADVMKNSTKGAYMENLSRASQKVEMMIRMLAETGLKPMMREIHGILLRNQDQEKIVKMFGKYVPVNPRQWRERTDMTTKVGLGTGTEEEKIKKLAIMQSLQEGLKDEGLVGPEESYSMFGDMAEAIGFELPEKYAMNPESDKFKAAQKTRAEQSGKEKQAEIEAQSNMLAKAEEVKGQFALMNTQHKIRMDALQDQTKQQIAIIQERNKKQMAELKEALAVKKSTQDNQIKLVVEEMRNKNSQMIESAKLESNEAIVAVQEELKAFIAGTKIDIGRNGIGTLPNANSGAGEELQEGSV